MTPWMLHCDFLGCSGLSAGDDGRLPPHTWRGLYHRCGTLPLSLPNDKVHTPSEELGCGGLSAEHGGRLPPQTWGAYIKNQYLGGLYPVSPGHHRTS